MGLANVLIGDSRDDLATAGATGQFDLSREVVHVQPLQHGGLASMGSVHHLELSSDWLVGSKEI
jgi:hypothetical protein